MNNELPIVILPSRRKWGVLTLGSAMLFAGYLFLVLDGGFDELPGDWEKYGIHAFGIFAGCFVPYGAWECLAAPPRMIIDEGGISGRFAVRGLAGVKIAWDDIIEARLWQFRFHGTTTRILYLDVNNEGGKYIPVRPFAHKLGSFSEGLSKKVMGESGSPFAFNITNSKLSEEEMEEIVAVINKLAKGKPPESGKPEESGKSPFAAD